MQMKSVVVDKIGSIAQACGLGHELRVATTDIPCEEGVVLVVEVLTNKSTYNQLELTSGRMAKVSNGDVIVGALGHRQALFGYSGHIPEQVAVGDIIQVLNIGGVLGICDSVNPDRGQPFDARVLGCVLQFPFLGERIGDEAQWREPRRDQFLAARVVGSKRASPDQRAGQRQRVGCAVSHDARPVSAHARSCAQCRVGLHSSSSRPPKRGDC